MDPVDESSQMRDLKLSMDTQRASLYSFLGGLLGLMLLYLVANRMKIVLNAYVPAVALVHILVMATMNEMNFFLTSILYGFVYMSYIYASRWVPTIAFYLSIAIIALILEMPLETIDKCYIIHACLSMILNISFTYGLLGLIEANKEVMRKRKHLDSRFLTLIDDYCKEIRTISTTVVGYVGLLVDTNLSIQQKEYIESLKRSLDYLITFVNNVNIYFRTELTSFDANSSNLLPLEPMLDSLMGSDKMIRKESSNVTIVSYIEPDVPKLLHGSREYLEMLLAHLLDNSRKFTYQGQIALYIRVLSRTNSDCKLSFCIEDTGIGILPERLDNVFTFLSNRQSELGMVAGSDPGLGLPICLGIAKLFKDGQFDISSEPGQGTKVTFSATFKISQRTKPGDLSLIDTRILVFGSEPQLSSIVSNLQWKGFRDVDTSTCKETVCQKLKRACKGLNPFDVFVVCSQVQGKELVDTSFVKALREDPAFTSLRIILICSKAYVLNNGAEYFDSYIQRPILFSQLQKALSVVPNDALRKSLSGGSDKIKLNVLIAEDNLYNRVVLKNLITNEGHNCIETLDGLECFQTYKKVNHSTDIVFMDYLMPTLDGVESTKLIRKYEIEKKIPRVLIVGLTADYDLKERCLESGMDDCFIKPIDPKNVTSILKQAVSKKKHMQRMKSESGKKDVTETSSKFGCILVVEDNPFVAKITTQLLLRNHWDVDLAIDGIESVERVAGNHSNYACILMDLYLPNMDGITATKEIRQFEKENDLPPKPIIMLTADDTIEVRNKCIDSGCTYYLQKPLNYERFIRLLRKLWKN